MAVTHDDGFAPLRQNFLENLSRIARDEFARALPAIPCTSLMRPRAEARGRQALEHGLYLAMHKLNDQEVADVKA